MSMMQVGFQCMFILILNLFIMFGMLFCLQILYFFKHCEQVWRMSKFCACSINLHYIHMLSLRFIHIYVSCT